MGFANGIIGGAATLIRAAIKSPNYAAGVAGWSVNKDGTADFNNATVRGTVTAGVFQGVNYVINASGAFFYASTPALGNLILAIAASSGTDPYGNGYPGGVSTFDNSTGNFATLTGHALNLADNGGDNWAVTTVTSGSPYLAFHAPAPAGLAVAYVDGAGNLVANEPGSSLTPETWHSPPAPSGWAAGDSGRTAIRFMRKPDNTVMIDIDMVATATATAGGNLTLCTLPAGWAPSVPHRTVIYMGAAADHTAALLQCQTDGTVVVDAIPAVTTSTRLAGIVTVPLD